MFVEVGVNVRNIVNTNKISSIQKEEATGMGEQYSRIYFGKDDFTVVDEPYEDLVKRFNNNY